MNKLCWWLCRGSAGVRAGFGREVSLLVRALLLFSRQTVLGATVSVGKDAPVLGNPDRSRQHVPVHVGPGVRHEEQDPIAEAPEPEQAREARRAQPEQEDQPIARRGALFCSGLLFRRFPR